MPSGGRTPAARSAGPRTRGTGRRPRTTAGGPASPTAAPGRAAAAAAQGVAVGEPGRSSLALLLLRYRPAVWSLAAGSAAEEAGGAVADGQGELVGLLVAELGPPGGADVEGVDHPVAQGVDLGHTDVEVEVAEGGGDGVEQTEGVAGPDLDHGRVRRLVGQHPHVGLDWGRRAVVAGLALQAGVHGQPA